MANFDNKAPFEQIAATQQEFVNYTYENSQEFADSVDKKLHRGVFARSDAFNFGFKRREKPHDALGQVTQVSGRIAAGKADVTTLFRLLKIDTVAHVLSVGSAQRGRKGSFLAFKSNSGLVTFLR